MAQGNFELIQQASDNQVLVLLFDNNHKLLANQLATNWGAALNTVASMVSQVGTPTYVTISVETG